jgi:hypothetical protein
MDQPNATEQERPMTRFFDHVFPSCGQKGMIGIGMEIEEKSLNVEERSVGLTLTEESPDSYGDIVEVSGVQLKRFLKNPVLLQFHDYQRWPLGTIAGLEKTDNRLRGKKIYAPEGIYKESDIGWGLTLAKILRGQSIGFLPMVSLEIETSDASSGYYRPKRYRKIELLEVSDAPVPAHANALADSKDAEFQVKELGEMVLRYGSPKNSTVEMMNARVKALIEFLTKSFAESERAATSGQTPSAALPKSQDEPKPTLAIDSKQLSELVTRTSKLITEKLKPAGGI